MIGSRTFRVWFVSTLLSASCAVIVLTAWLVWPSFHEYWTVRTLITKLKEADEKSSALAKLELQKIGSPAVTALLEVLKDEDADAELINRAWCTLTDARMDGDHKRMDTKAAIPTLIAAAQDKHRRVRCAACVLLGYHGQEANIVVPTLTEALKDESAAVRACAVRALGEIGPDARSATDALQQLQDDESVRVCIDSVFALYQIGAIDKAEASRRVVPWTRCKDNGADFSARAALAMLDRSEKEKAKAKARSVKESGAKFQIPNSTDGLRGSAGDSKESPNDPK